MLMRVLAVASILFVLSLGAPVSLPTPKLVPGLDRNHAIQQRGLIQINVDRRAIGPGRGTGTTETPLIGSHR